ncbi:MAG: hypothetical protein CMJ78_21135 [Planctomycetaceae bacterium]|nr:hypothetical protein [Planctomycetaceae bacterium]
MPVHNPILLKVQIRKRLIGDTLLLDVVLLSTESVVGRASSTQTLKSLDSSYNSVDSSKAS